MNSEQLVAYWVNSANEDFISMNVLFKKKRYVHSLFWGHLMIEKMFKALYAKTHTEAPAAPKVHDLTYLANKCKLVRDDKIESYLELVTRFNIAGRYEDEKQQLYKLCTKEWTTENIKKIKELKEWLKKLITQ